MMTNILYFIFFYFIFPFSFERLFSVPNYSWNDKNNDGLYFIVFINKYFIVGRLRTRLCIMISHLTMLNGS